MWPQSEVLAPELRGVILSGHDLLVIEGNPIDKIYSRILKKACSGEVASLKSNIESAAQRIASFKERTKQALEYRVSKEWLEANRPAIEFLAFNLFPRLNAPAKPCTQADAVAAQRQLRCLDQR